MLCAQGVIARVRRFFTSKHSSATHPAVSNENVALVDNASVVPLRTHEAPHTTLQPIDEQHVENISGQQDTELKKERQSPRKVKRKNLISRKLWPVSANRKTAPSEQATTSKATNLKSTSSIVCFLIPLFMFIRRFYCCRTQVHRVNKHKTHQAHLIIPFQRITTQLE
jgi:hypothetical protein